MDEELKKLVDAWIKVSGALNVFQGEPGSEDLDPNFWASERLYDLVQNEPEKAWPIILAIRNATNDYKVLAHLAASHFEDLINAHGEKFIDRIEALAKEDESFRRFIGGVWPRRDIPPQLLERLEAIALKPYWD